jgi:S-DNA-T family DNA segregation ATPase FtsK/SpoIIIE
LLKIISFILAFLLIYFSYSIFVSTQIEIGLIGYSIAQFSHIYFGYLSYIYLLALLYPLYKLNFSKIKYTNTDIFYNIIYGVFFFVVLLILQR